MKHRIANHFLFQSLFCLSLFLVSGCANSEQVDTLQQVTEHVIVDANLLEALKQDLRDFEETLHIIRKGAGRWEDVAAYIDKQKESRLADWKKAAEQGIPEGQVLLGYSLLFVPGGDGFNAEAAEWFRKAAEQGHPDGLFRLGMYYSVSVQYGFHENLLIAVEWLQKAGEQGHAEALNHIGWIHTWGNDRAGISADPDEAAKWFRKAAELGHADAQVRLAWYLVDNIVFQNPVTRASLEQYRRDVEDSGAEEWFRKAAEQGHAQAQYVVGMAYYERRDMEEATRWLHKSAEQGYEDADEALMRIFVNPR